MNADTCGIVIYTQNGAIPFEVEVTISDFQERLAEALEQGTVMLSLADGGKLVLCAINVVAIEVREIDNTEEMTSDTPPVKNI